MSEQTTNTQTGGFAAGPGEAFEAAVAGGGCCGAPAPAASARGEAQASPCCGTALQASADGSCCGAAAKADAVASGAGCCG